MLGPFAVIELDSFIRTSLLVHKRKTIRIIRWNVEKGQLAVNVFGQLACSQRNVS